MELYTSGIARLTALYGAMQGRIYDTITHWVQAKKQAIKGDDFELLDLLNLLEEMIYKELILQDTIANNLSELLGVIVRNYARECAITYLEAEGLQAPVWIAEGTGIAVAPIAIGAAVVLVVSIAAVAAIITEMENSERYAKYLGALVEAAELGIPLESIPESASPSYAQTKIEVPLVSEVGSGVEAVGSGIGEGLKWGAIALALVGGIYLYGKSR